MSTNQSPYTPNHIPRSERIINVLCSGVLILYGTFGVLKNDLFMPGKGRGGMHMHGPPAWLMFAAFLSASANMLAVVVDHYDKRNNETNYKLFARITQVAGWLLFIASLLSELFIFHSAGLR